MRGKKKGYIPKVKAQLYLTKRQSEFFTEMSQETSLSFSESIRTALDKYIDARTTLGRLMGYRERD